MINLNNNDFHSIHKNIFNDHLSIYLNKLRPAPNRDRQQNLHKHQKS